jgi:hypothetical protein
MPFDNFFGCPEPKSGADIQLGGEERFKDAVQMFGRDSISIVCDDQQG